MTKSNFLSTDKKQFLINDWGADIILGHHPHVLQGFEHYKKGVIFYSLGNFVFDMLWNENFRTSIIVFFDFSSSNGFKFDVVPVTISKQYQPEVDKIKGGTTIKLFQDLSKKIEKEFVGDLEENNYLYYMEYERKRIINRYESYKYFFKNLVRVNKIVFFQIIFRTVSRRVKDLKNLTLRYFF